MGTQFSNNIVSSPEPKTRVRYLYTNGLTFVISSFVHLFKIVYQRTIFSQIEYYASSSNEGERFHVVFGLIGLELWHITPINL